MAKECFEEASASEHSTGSYAQENEPTLSKRKGIVPFRAITLIALPLLWIGYFYSLYQGNDSNMSNYSLVILMFSMLNADVLIKGEKLPNKVLDILAKVNCIMVFIWAVITVVQLLLK